MDLKGIDYIKHQKSLYELLSIDSNVKGFINFQRALSIDATNNETKCLQRKAHLFSEIPVIDMTVNELMDIYHSGKSQSINWPCLEK